MMEMVSKVSSFALREGSTAFMSFSLFVRMDQNQAAKYWLSSGRSSSSAIRPVNSSIKTTP